jgi:hypothetical protein
MFGPFSGFALAVWQVLIGPRTLVVLLVWLALGAAAGLAAGPGAHPAEGVLLHVPGVLLPFVVLARFRTLPATLFAAGLVVALVGVLLAGRDFGRLEVQPGAETEAYERPSVARPVRTHLGGILRTAAADERSMTLSLGAGTFEYGQAIVSRVDGREQSLGPWQVRFREVTPGRTPNQVRLRATAAGQPPQTLTLRAGGSATLPDGASVTVVALEPDYGQGLGPAAQLGIREAGTGATGRTDWFFVESPDLDARLGQGTWRFELMAVEAAPGWVVDVHRRGVPWVAAAGWGLMALALVLLAARRPEVA